MPGRQEDRMEKKELALAVIERLKEAYPDADCSLDYDEAWKLLVSVRLAAQCTDARVNMVTPALFARFPTLEAFAEADVTEVEELIRSCGFYHTKARNIVETAGILADQYGGRVPDTTDATPEEIEAIVHPCGLGRSKARDINACMKMLRDTYGGRVPDTMEELLALPGVGRKSANLVLGDVFGKPAIVTDTHCIRLCNRIGLVDRIKEPKKVEMALWKIVPPEEGNALCHRFVLHGRAVCSARTKPDCAHCVLEEICEKNGVEEGKR